MSYELTGFVPKGGETVQGAPEAPDGAAAALFLDFDGCLVDIAPTPDAVVVPEGLGALLAALGSRFGGAVAVVTGRAVETVERFLPGYAGDVVGAHGAERRQSGVVERHRLAGSESVRRLQEDVRALGRLDPGFLVEDKPVGAVLHYRRNPDLAAEAQRLMQGVAARFPEFALQPAKMAVELKPADTGKAASVRWLMQRPPYLGRRPIVFGDDLTDEPAMAFAVASGGAAVKVGEGETRASHRLAGPAEVRAVLSAWARGGRPRG